MVPHAPNCLPSDIKEPNIGKFLIRPKNSKLFLELLLFIISHFMTTVLPLSAKEIFFSILTPVYFSASGLASSGLGTV